VSSRCTENVSERARTVNRNSPTASGTPFSSPVAAASDAPGGSAPPTTSNVAAAAVPPSTRIVSA
jgi:hypothetical protein